jgi:hypothetical protein
MMCRMWPHTAVIRVYDAAGKVIDTHEHARFQRVLTNPCAKAVRPCKDKRGVVFISDVLPWPFSCAEKFFDL